jgi:hypothetical protein
MKDYAMRAIIYIAGRLLLKINSAEVYDYNSGLYYKFSGDVTPDKISIYDYEQHCHISGKIKEGVYHLYHYGLKKPINLEIAEDGFHGYDYDSGKYFSGAISGSSGAVSVLRLAVSTSKRPVPQMGVIPRVRELYPNLNSALQKVADIIQKEPETAFTTSINEVAEAAGVSQGTVTRFCRSLGFKGFQEFKIALAREMGFPEEQVQPIRLPDEEYEQSRYFNYAG